MVNFEFFGSAIPLMFLIKVNGENALMLMCFGSSLDWGYILQNPKEQLLISKTEGFLA